MEWMVMPLRRYAEFSGRSRRQEFWMWQLFKFLVSLALMIVFGAVLGVSIGAMASNPDPLTASTGSVAALGAGVLILYLVLLLLGLAVLIPDIAVTVRRLHDTNRSGLWLLAIIAPYFLGVVVTVIGGMAQSAGLALIGGAITLLGLLGVLALLVFMFLDGTPGPNRYGPDPKGRTAGSPY